MTLLSKFDGNSPSVTPASVPVTPEPIDTPRGTYSWAIASKDSFDPELFRQILDRYRSDWPNGFRGVNEGRNWIALPSDQPLHVALLSGDRSVASHAAFVSRQVTIGGEPFKACGIIGLFTQPGHAWLAPRIMKYVSDVLVPASRADFVLGFCEDGPLVRWYERLGLAPHRGARVRVDPRNDDPVIIDDEIMMARALTPEGVRALERVSHGEELYFGSRPTW